MMTAVFMLFLAVQARFSPDQLPPSSERASWRQRMAGLLDLVPVVGLILVVIGGIYVGIMTPTEAAGIGAAGAVVVAAIYGGLTLDVLRRSLLDALRTNAMILFIVIGAQILSFALVSAGIPRAIVSAINALDAAPYMVLLLVVVMYLILGCLVDALS